MPSRKTQRIPIKTVEGVRPKRPYYPKHKAPEVEEKPRKPLFTRRFFATIGIIVGIVGILLGGVSWLAYRAVDAYVVSGNAFVSEKKYGAAQQQYEVAMALRIFHPTKSAEAFLAMGNILWQKHQEERALDYYREAVASAPKNENIASTAARALLLHSKTAEAVKVLEGTTQDAPMITTLRAYAAVQSGNVVTATALFQKAASSGDSEAKIATWVNAVATGSVTPSIVQDAEVAAGDRNETQKFSRLQASADKTVARIQPPTAQALVQFGTTLLNEDMPEFAAQMATQALEKDPKYRDAFTLISASKLALYNYDEAFSALKKSLAISPLKPDLWFLQAKISDGYHDADQAKIAYQKAEELGQDTAEFHFAYGSFLERTGKNEDALVQLKKASDLMPENQKYLMSFYFAALENNNLKLAQDIADAAQKKFEKSDFGYAARAFVGYKNDEADAIISQNITMAYTKNSESAFAAYVEGVQLRKENPDSAAEKFLQARDWDFGGEISNRAENELEILNRNI